MINLSVSLYYRLRDELVRVNRGLLTCEGIAGPLLKQIFKVVVSFLVERKRFLRTLVHVVSLLHSIWRFTVYQIKDVVICFWLLSCLRSGFADIF